MRRRGAIPLKRLIHNGAQHFESSSTLARCRFRQYPQQSTRLSSPLSATCLNNRFVSSIPRGTDEDPDESAEYFSRGAPVDDEVDDYGIFDDHKDSHDDDWQLKNSKKDRDRNTEEVHKRIWLDPSTKLEVRVNKFVNRRLGTMHPLDIRLASVDLIRECGKLNSFEGMKYAHDILDRILEEKRYTHQSDSNSRSLLFVAERPFQVLMYGWANLCQNVPLAPQRMREVLDLMVQEAEYDETVKRELKANGKIDGEALHDLPSCEPTVDIYNTLLQGLVQASFRSIAAASEAEEVLSAMIGRNRKRGWHTKPNTKTFTLAMTAFSKTRHVTAGNRAESILRRMQKYHEQERQLYREETGVEYDRSDPSSNRRQIVTPDTLAFSVVIQAHAQSDADGSTEKAVALLSEVLESEDPALEPDGFIFANTINAFARLASKKKSEKARLATAERAEELVWLMVDELKHAQSEKASMMENVIGKQSDSDEESPSRTSSSPLKSKLGQQLASVIPFNACLNVWAQSNTSESAARAEDLLHKMLDPVFFQDTGIVPSISSFNTCMQAWAKAARDEPDAPERAEELLTLLASLDDGSGGTGHTRADVGSYSTVMTAFAKSKRADKVAQVRRLLDSLLSSYKNHGIAGRLSAVPFTVLLNAVAHSPNSQEMDDDQVLFAPDSDGVIEMDDDPYTIALETYLELQEDLHDLRLRADHMTYATMLDVVAKHTEIESIERRQRIDRVFEDARSSGQVSSSVVTSLMRACPSQDMLQTLLKVRDPMSISNINALPREWTRHVPPRFRKLQAPDDKYNRKKTGDRRKKNRQAPKKYRN
eukprot:scaffold405_cov132-Cylindrotheca_fusiformis.AAC.3